MPLFGAGLNRSLAMSERDWGICCCGGGGGAAGAIDGDNASYTLNRDDEDEVADVDEFTIGRCELIVCSNIENMINISMMGDISTGILH